MTRTLAFPAAAPAAAVEYFGAELGFEVDPDDLVQDLEAGRTDGYVVVETRAAEAFAHARIPGAINLPYRDLTPETTSHLDRDLVYVCYCESTVCNAATKGALKLAELGFKVKRLSGGITGWIAAGYPVEGAVLEGAVLEGDKAGGIRCAC
ncbi:rhodanese-like domain-containing protein [Amycolatopsis sp. DG1A-15b]|uniref:rhodanese-like domain-containing protein n=1 Tax=Amycolatopsis sp. DG1A-15b TaxID=3052846 RepID=UPI00255BA5B7|nr:rhodanese-like domain-containing protein [Amycolatopsis sp. DG1A-15b]WIX88008.1 rhodanese-like domain-containing protein [Amycolatopsis sp. DG1A-15b]